MERPRVVRVGEVAMVGDHALIGGYAAWFLARMIEGFPGGLEPLLARSGVPPERRQAVRRAACALEEAGAAWRLAHAARASTSGSDEGADRSSAVRSTHGHLGAPEVASILGVSSRRVRMLADEGELRGERDAGGRWLFDPTEVAAMKAARDERTAL